MNQERSKFITSKMISSLAAIRKLGKNVENFTELQHAKYLEIMSEWLDAFKNCDKDQQYNIMLSDETLRAKLDEHKRTAN
jgi:hypothetical protein